MKTLNGDINKIANNLYPTYRQLANPISCFEEILFCSFLGNLNSLHNGFQNLELKPQGNNRKKLKP